MRWREEGIRCTRTERCIDIPGTMVQSFAEFGCHPETMAMGERRWVGYVALGDAVTEGTGVAGEPSWAPRLATILQGSAQLDGQPFAFRNLAEHGHRMRDVAEQQVPAALALRPDLVSIMAGGTELQRSRADPAQVATRLESAVAMIRATGADVLIANVVDPLFAFFMRPTRNRVAAFNANVWSIARTHGAYTLDVWNIRELQGGPMWSPDRRQLTPAGHRVVANRAAQALGVPYFDLFPEASARM